MRTLLLFFVVFVLTLSAANFKLYLKDGGFQLVREYQVDGDRVKYYSVERSDWEEMPADLVDLKRTDAEAAARKETLDKAGAGPGGRGCGRARKPPGDYENSARPRRLSAGGRQASHLHRRPNATIHNSKGRNVLSAVVPMVSGQSDARDARRAFDEHRDG